MFDEMQTRWLLLPRPWMTVRPQDVRENEPIRDDGAATSVAERVYRDRAAVVYVKGAVRRPDRATIRLPFWHQVVMNAYAPSRATEGIAIVE